MIGSRTTWNELIKLGEKVRGKKFLVQRSKIDEALSKCDPNPKHRMVNFMQEVLIATCQGEFNYEATLNQKIPAIRPTNIDEFVYKWWSGKEGQTF
jgi:hypothetical protein